MHGAVVLSRLKTRSDYQHCGQITCFLMHFFRHMMATNATPRPRMCLSPYQLLTSLPSPLSPGEVQRYPFATQHTDIKW
jgi:hypothetical protein